MFEDQKSEEILERVQVASKELLPAKYGDLNEGE